MVFRSERMTISLHRSIVIIACLLFFVMIAVMRQRSSCSPDLSEKPVSLRKRSSHAFGTRQNQPPLTKPTWTPARNGTLSSTFLSFIEDHDGFEHEEQHKARLATLKVVLIEPVVESQRHESSTCPYIFPHRVATVKVQKRLGDGAIVAETSSGDPGSEHLPLYQNIIDLAKPRPCVAIDCGANEGVITTFLGNRCRVYSYEALRSNYRRVYSSVQSSPNLKSNVRLFHAAISNTCLESLSISENHGGDESAQHNGQINFDSRPDNSLVYTRRIDDDVKEDVLLLKIDIEGFEPLGLAGAIQLLATRNVPFLHVEFSPSNVPLKFGSSSWLYTMAGMGYEIYLGDCVGDHSILSGFVVSCASQDSRMPSRIVQHPESVLSRRIFVEEIPDFVRKLQRNPSAQVNLLLFNRQAFEQYGASKEWSK